MESAPGAAAGPAGPRRTGAENRKNYSGKHKCHGLLVSALTGDNGRPL
ncbi:hypothetical protein AB0F05_34110 [Streptomyces microflavus]